MDAAGSNVQLAFGPTVENGFYYDFLLDELKRNAGTQFDPEILKHMVVIIEDGYAPVSDAEMEDYEI